MRRKTVTFIVPAYNSEKYLDKCLSSFVCDTLSAMEIIVVDDGSKDGTARIAEAYADKYPDSFKLVSKKNGGHGSAINLAARIVRGRYFRVVDSDDWVLTENLHEYAELLNNASADAVITNFHTVNAVTGKKTPIKHGRVVPGRNYSLAEVMETGKEALSCCMIHGITYRTAFYLSCGVSLSEGVSYEDQEYCTIPFAEAESVMFLDLFLYEYLIGTALQSVSDANQVKRAPQLELVFWKIAEAYRNRGKLSQAARGYYLYKLAETLQNYYVTMFIRSEDRSVGRKEAKRLRRLSSEYVPELKSATGFRYILLYVMHILRIKPRHLESLRNSRLYLWLRRAVR